MERLLSSAAFSHWLVYLLLAEGCQVSSFHREFIQLSLKFYQFWPQCTADALSLGMYGFRVVMSVENWTLYQYVIPSLPVIIFLVWCYCTWKCMLISAFFWFILTYLYQHFTFLLVSYKYFFFLYFYYYFIFYNILCWLPILDTEVCTCQSSPLLSNFGAFILKMSFS